MKERNIQHREPLDAIAGAIGGALFGLCVWLSLIGTGWLILVVPGLPGFPSERFFPLDLLAFVTVGAVACGVLGYWRGTPFFQWVRDHWPGSDQS